MRHKEYSFFSQSVIPGVVVVTSVDGDNTAFREVQGTANFDITDLAFGDDGEFGQVAIVDSNPHGV